MGTNHKTRNDPKADFSFGIRELRQAKAAQKLNAVDPAPLRAANQNRGFDPYNTSGSFDRKKNWARVGKR